MRPSILLLPMLVANAFAVPAVGETVRLGGATYSDFARLQAQQGDGAFAIKATLDFPERARNRHPAVVIVHTLGGYLDANEGWHAAELRKAGFATLTYDSDAARRLRDGGLAAAGWSSAVAEASAAFNALAADRRIDADRIAILGFSFGGEVAHLAALERLRAALLPGQARFAAHVAYYPAGVYGTVVGRGTYTGAPILMLTGAQDDNLPVLKIAGYIAHASQAGFAPPIDLKVYPNAYHAWTVAGLGAPRFYPRYRSTRKCPYLLLDGARTLLLIGGQEKPIERDLMARCTKEGRGYTMGYDEAIRAASLSDATTFLRDALR